MDVDIIVKAHSNTK